MGFKGLSLGARAALEARARKLGRVEDEEAASKAIGVYPKP